jgi:glycosyltransferase involved in cell wall biosynthesis
MTHMPRLTIVLPVYNHERYVEQALQSLYAQDYTDFQIIAVDDSSTDNSLEVLNRHRDRVLFLESPHHAGPACARNRALQAADSELVAFMDADDLCEPERLRLQVEMIEHRDLVASSLIFIDNEGRPLPGLWTCPPEAGNHYWAALLERNWIGTPSVMIRRDVLDTTGMFDERFTHAEDYDLWLRIGRRHSIGYIQTPLIRCRRHATNTSIDIDSHQRFERLALEKVDIQDARDAFESLYANPQRRAEAWVWFLLRRGETGFREEASCAVRQYPCSSSLRFALGVFEYDSGAYDHARTLFAALKDFDASALHNLGVVNARCGNIQAATGQLQTALIRRPGYRDAELNLAAIRQGLDFRLTRRPLRQNLIPMG